MRPPPARASLTVRLPPTRAPDTRGARGSAAAARGRQGAAGPAPPRRVPLPRPSSHSRIFTRRWSRRAAAACRASRRRCNSAVRWPSAAAWPSSSPKMSPAQRDRSASCASRQTRARELTCSSERKSGASAARAAVVSGRRSLAGSTLLWWKGMARSGCDRGAIGPPRSAQPLIRAPSARGASLHATQRKVRGSGGAPRGIPAALPAEERPAGRADRPSRGIGVRGARPPPGDPRAARRGDVRSGSRAGGRAASAGSPAEVCRRAGKRRPLLPSLPIGEGGGSGGSAADTGRGREARERKGGGEKGRPGNHLRLRGLGHRRPSAPCRAEPGRASPAPRRHPAEPPPAPRARVGRSAGAVVAEAPDGGGNPARAAHLRPVSQAPASPRSAPRERPGPCPHPPGVASADLQVDVIQSSSAWGSVAN
jgi:hypothetical protein